MDHQIVLLKGAQRVRRRAGVLFGDVGDLGAMDAVGRMIQILASECIDGHSDLLEISVNADHVVSISDHGRGIYFGTPEKSDDGIWKEMFCELYAGAKYADSTPKDTRYSIFDQDCTAEQRRWLIDDGAELYLVAVQYASEFMEVISVRDGYEYRLSFKHGEAIGGLSKAPSSAPTGTNITFRLDPEVFGAYALSATQMKEKADLLALANPGVAVKLSIGIEDIVTYCYPQGLQSYMELHRDDQQGTPIYRNLMAGSGQDRYNYPCYHAQVEVGIAFAPNQGYLKCLHNQQELPYGGTHVETLKDGIKKYMAYLLELHPSEKNLLQHLQLVVITHTNTIPRWENATQLSIAHNVLRDMAEDTLKDDFRSFLKQNAAILKQLYPVDL